MKYLKLITLVFLVFIVGFKKAEFPNKTTQQIPEEQMYFPSNTDGNWKTKSMYELGWNVNSVEALKE